jgi:6,7-dimethyl-8-ribityllumazine synthase
MRLEPVSSAVGPAGSGLDASDLRIAVFAAEFNSAFVEPMLDAARAAWVRAGGAPAAFVAHRVPGAFELPLACREAARTGRYHAVVALGCVIRGDTPHFDFVCAESARGLMQAGLETAVPVIFGVLTVDTLDQAWERAGTKAGNKGAEAAAAAIEMATLLETLPADPFEADLLYAPDAEPAPAQAGVDGAP